MSSMDQAWQDTLDSEAINSDRHGYTHRDIVMAMLTAYARLRKHRQESVNGVLSMSRWEYNEYKLPGDPHWWTIQEYAGGWSNAKKILPVPSEYLNKRNRRGDDASAEKFAQALHLVADHYQIQPHQVSVRQFMRYKKNHPEANLANFKVYSKYIAQSNRWDDAKDIALSGIGRKY